MFSLSSILTYNHTSIMELIKTKMKQAQFFQLQVIFGLFKKTAIFQDGANLAVRYRRVDTILILQWRNIYDGVLTMTNVIVFRFFSRNQCCNMQKNVEIVTGKRSRPMR